MSKLISVFLLLVSIHVHSQILPSFIKFDMDTMPIYHSMPSLIKLKLNQSDPNLIALRTSDIPNYMIQRRDDSTFIINQNQTAGNIKFKLYYKNLPIEVLNGTIGYPNLPTILVGDRKIEISKSQATQTQQIICLVEDDFRNLTSLELYAFDIYIHHANGAKEMLPNYSHVIQRPNLDRLLSLSSGTSISFINVKFRTIYNSIIVIPGETKQYPIIQ
jgi:hypothetical protein